MIHAADSKQLTLQKPLKALQLALRTLDCGPGLKNMVGDEKRGQGRKIWLGTKNMVRDENYGQDEKT